MKRVKRAGSLPLHAEALRYLATADLRGVAGGALATSEAIDGYPCPGEYSWACRP